MHEKHLFHAQLYSIHQYTLFHKEGYEQRNTYQKEKQTETEKEKAWEKENMDHI